MVSFGPGDRVRHPIHGMGTVARARSGFRAMVRFDSTWRMPQTVLERELILEQKAAPQPQAASGSVSAEAETQPRKRRPLGQNPPTRPDESLPAAARRFDAQGLAVAESFQVLEALRLGVVPHSGVEGYTIGRDAETASVKTMLELGRGCRVFWGDYGTGKTHMLEVAEQMARSQGFATARVTLDPKENALHHPLALYRRIADALVLPDGASQGLDRLFERLADSSAHNSATGPHRSRFYSPYLHVLRHGDEEQQGWFRDYVHGDPIDTMQLKSILGRLRWRGENPLAMSDFRTYGRMYIHLIGTLASWIKDAGAKGLVVLFDEVERIDVLTPTEQHYALEVLKHYAAVTMESEDLEFDPERDLYRGGHPVHQRIPLKYQDHQPLSVVFALTPLPEIEESFQDITKASAYDLRLRPPSAADLPELGNRIAALYERSYPEFDSAPHLEDVVEACADALDRGHADFRSAVRTAVFGLDAARFQSLLA